MSPKKTDDQYSELETQRRFEAALRGAREVGHEPKQDVPPESMMGAALADSLAKKFVSQGGNPADLFVALAGVICEKDQKLGLIASWLWKA